MGESRAGTFCAETSRREVRINAAAADAVTVKTAFFFTTPPPGPTRRPLGPENADRIDVHFIEWTRKVNHLASRLGGSV
jgi:hypothetical protein